MGVTMGVVNVIYVYSLEEDKPGTSRYLGKTIFWLYSSIRIVIYCLEFKDLLPE